MKKRSEYNRQNIEKQLGNRESWKFVSVTTPGHKFGLPKALAEFVILQRYGLDVPPYFWYKSTGCDKIREDFSKIENQIAGMIFKNDGITALQLLSIVCEKYKPLKNSETVIQEQAEQLDITTVDKPLISFADIQESKSENLRTSIGRISNVEEE